MRLQTTTASPTAVVTHGCAVIMGYLVTRATNPCVFCLCVSWIMRHSFRNPKHRHFFFEWKKTPPKKKRHLSQKIFFFEKACELHFFVSLRCVQKLTKMFAPRLSRRLEKVEGWETKQIKRCEKLKRLLETEEQKLKRMKQMKRSLTNRHHKFEERETSPLFQSLMQHTKFPIEVVHLVRSYLSWCEKCQFEISPPTCRVCSFQNFENVRGQGAIYFCNLDLDGSEVYDFAKAAMYFSKEEQLVQLREFACCARLNLEKIPSAGWEKTVILEKISELENGCVFLSSWSSSMTRVWISMQNTYIGLFRTGFYERPQKRFNFTRAASKK